MNIVINEHFSIFYTSKYKYLLLLFFKIGIIIMQLYQTLQIKSCGIKNVVNQRKSFRRDNICPFLNNIDCFQYLQIQKSANRITNKQKSQEYIKLSQKKLKIRQDSKIWMVEDQKKLEQLHNLMGNKWVQIAEMLNKRENEVKNHYYSKLRKGIRKMNKFISQNLELDYRPFKVNIISKIIQAAQQLYSSSKQSIQTKTKVAFDLKNRIWSIVQLFNSKRLQLADEYIIKSLIKDLAEFNTRKKRQKVAVNDNASSIELQRSAVINPQDGLTCLVKKQTPQKIQINQGFQNISKSAGVMDMACKQQNIEQIKYKYIFEHPTSWPYCHNYNPWYYPYHLPSYLSPFNHSPYRYPDNEMNKRNSSSLQKQDKDVNKLMQCYEKLGQL